MTIKTHYDPYFYAGMSGSEGGGEPYYPPDDYIHLCGTKVSPDRDYEVTNDWEQTTCKRCLMLKESIDNRIKDDEKAIVKDMGQMAYWWENSKCLVCDGAGHSMIEVYPQPKCIACDGTGLKQGEKVK